MLIETPPQPASTPHDPPTFSGAWSRSAQYALVCLFLCAIALLSWHYRDAATHGARPTELRDDTRVDLNRADRAELLLVPGIGPKLAQRILDYRAKMGGFKSIDELRNVKGIGDKTLEQIEPRVKVIPLFDEERDDPPRRILQTVRAQAQTRLPTTPLQKNDPDRAGLVNVNTASAAELKSLPGIGEKLAKRIIERRRIAPFRTVEELIEIERIGTVTMDGIRPLVTVGP